METMSDAPVTSIVSDSGITSAFVAGFADGTVRVFDRRLEEEDAIVRCFDAHSSWVQNVYWHPNLGSQILTARFVSYLFFEHKTGRIFSLEGDVKLWDLRGSQAPLHTIELHPHGLASFDVHSQTGVCATLSCTMWLKVQHLADIPNRTSALTPSQWRSQRIMINPLMSTSPLSSFTVTTGLGAYRTPQSSFIPRSTSFAFHPLEMVYGIGEPDGSGECFFAHGQSED
jgi:regulatory associated protein of mTOR